MLILTNIKTSRVNNRVNLIFSDSSYLPFFIDDVFKLNLKKGQSINSKKLNLLKEKSFYYLGREYTLRQIAISPKTQKTLSQKLKIFFRKRNPSYPSSKIIADIISELKSKKLINNDDFIYYFINKNRHRSKKEIIYRLGQQGIILDPQKLNKMIPDNDLILIQRFLNKKKINRKDMKNFNYRQKIIASLFRRGFKLENIRNVIDESFKLK